MTYLPFFAENYIFSAFLVQMKQNISDFELDFCFAVEKHYKSSFVDVLDTF